MGRRRWNKKHPDQAQAQQQPRRPEEAGDPPVRLLALQPNSTIVGVAIGNRVTFVDYKTGRELQLAGPKPAATVNAATAEVSSGGAHTNTLRVLQFSPDGQFLLTGADEKVAKLWKCAPEADANAIGGAWRCVAAWRTPKKTSVGGFSLNGAYAFFADKFGDVLVGRVPAPEEQVVAAGTASAPEEPCPLVPSTLLGHFCTIVTGLAASPCGRFLATSDREYKVRVSLLPEDLLQGSYEIQGYCLGHQDFAYCITFAVKTDDEQQQQQQQGDGENEVEGTSGKVRRSVLLSGGGDGTVRVWDYETCTQLSCYVASAPATAARAAVAQVPGEEGDAGAAVTTAAGAAAGVEVGSAPEDAGGAEEASGGGDEGDDEGDGEEDGTEGGEGPSGMAQGEGNGDGAGGGGGGRGGTLEEPQRRSKAPPCAPVLSLATAPDGCTVAVVVEGEDDIQLLSLDWNTGVLELRQRLRWPDVRYPCQAAFEPTGQLWVVGGVPLPTTRSAHIGVAQRGPDGHFVVCTEEVVSTAVRSLLEARVEEEEARLAEGGELFVYSKRLRKPTYDNEDVQQFKRKRNDFRERQRLAALRLRQDEQVKQQQLQATTTTEQQKADMEVAEAVA